MRSLAGRRGAGRRAARPPYLPASEWTLSATPSAGRSSLGKWAILRSFSPRCASTLPIAQCPSKTTPSWITRLGVRMLPMSRPGARISRRLRAVTSPVTRPWITTELPAMFAFTTALSPIVSASCAAISPSTCPSMRAGPSNMSLPVTWVPLPRNALVPLGSSLWPVRPFCSNISASPGSRPCVGPVPTGTGRGFSPRSRSLPNSAMDCTPRTPAPPRPRRGGHENRAYLAPAPGTVKAAGGRAQDATVAPRCPAADRRAGRARRPNRTRSRSSPRGAGVSRPRRQPPAALRELFRLGLRKLARHHLTGELHLLVDALDGEHGAGVSRAELAGLELRLHGIGERQEAERVGDRGPTLADACRDLLLGHAVDLAQVPIGLGLLERRQVLALEVLDEGELEPLARGAFPHQHGHLREPGTDGCPQAALAGNHLVAAGHGAHDERLRQPVPGDRVRERGERLLVEVPPRLLRVRDEGRHRHPHRRRGRRAPREQCAESPAERLARHSLPPPQQP